MPEPQPYAGTVSNRRAVRQDIRNKLGVSHEGPPSLRQLAGVIAMLDNLVKLSTAGDYNVRLQRRDGTLVDKVWMEWKAAD